MLVTTSNGVGVEDLAPLVLSEPFRVWPNPGSGPVSISFGLGKPASVRLRVVDVAGRIVEQFVDGRLAAGGHIFSSRRQLTGVYVAELVLNGVDKYKSKFVITR